MTNRKVKFCRALAVLKFRINYGCKRSRAAKPTYNSYTSSEIRQRDMRQAGGPGKAINFSNKICGGDRVLTEREREDIVKIETELSCELRRPQKDHHG